MSGPRNSAEFPSFTSASLRSLTQSHESRRSGLKAISCMLNSTLALIRAVPFSPLRVVIIITPLAPRTPNTAVAEASFNTEILAISFGSIDRISSTATPSTIINGFVPFVVAAPRRNMVTSSRPGSPEVWIVVNPGSFPDKAELRLGDEDFIKSFRSMEATEPMTETFFWVP